jgi:hypothetical protein
MKRGKILLLKISPREPIRPVRVWGLEASIAEAEGGPRGSYHSVKKHVSRIQFFPQLLAALDNRFQEKNHQYLLPSVSNNQKSNCELQTEAMQSAVRNSIVI